jgi:hypothetical protein
MGEQDQPPADREHRLIGISDDGRRVDNVAENNRWHINTHTPDLQISLMTEDLSRCIRTVYIPNTREMPDAVVFEGEYFEVVDTRLKPPQYRQCMVSTAYTEPKKGKHDETTD